MLPTERGLKTALIIYGIRLAVMLVVAGVGFAILAMLWVVQ